jgi:hypothetical protein
VRARVFSKLTYANVMATIAVFIALGSGAYAAFHLPRDSVKSKNIVNRQVKQADVSHTLTVSGANFATNAGHATNADSLDGHDSAHFGVGIMGGLMKDVTNNDVLSGILRAPIGTSTGTATGSFVAPAGGFVARDLEISLASPNGAGETHRFAFQAPGSDLECTVPENASSCSDTTHAVTVGAGQSYSMLETAATGTPRTVDVSFGWRAVSP